MKKGIVCIIVSMMFLLTSLTFSVATHNESGPVLYVGILTGIQFPGPSFRVKNIGDESAHNVELIDIAVDGNVLYNNRSEKIADELEPGDGTIDAVNSCFIGYGVFSMVLTVTCDEGVFYSDKTNGIIIGPFMFIL
ncbi:MAG: hypothetical protein K8R68_04385 [Bacteroidales bacterium]|nr:hypothetical protein [Bacteroidales bacterium]